MTKYIFYALMLLALTCLVLLAATTMTNGGVVFKTFATHPDTPPAGGLLMWAKSDGTFQSTNSSGTDAGMGGGGSGGAGPIVAAYNTAAYLDATFPTTTQTAVTFDSHDFDTSSGAMHSTTTNTSRFLAPSDGYYWAACNMRLNAGASFLLYLQVDGTTQVPGSGAGESTLTTYSIRKAAAYVHLTAGHYVECMLQPNSGTDHPANGITLSGANFQFVKLF